MRCVRATHWMRRICFNNECPLLLHELAAHRWVLVGGPQKRVLRGARVPPQYCTAIELVVVRQHWCRYLNRPLEEHLRWFFFC